MKRLLAIILAAAALVASPAAGQTIKSLGFNTTNGEVVYSGASPLTFTNSLQFSTNSRAVTRTNLGAGSIGDQMFTQTTAAGGRGVLGGSSFGGAIFTGSSATNRPVLIASILGFSVTNNLGFDSSLTNLWLATNPAAAVTALGLGGTNTATFGNVVLNNDGNLAPAQTADSGDSLMTRGLVDQRQIDRMIAGPRMIWLTTFTGYATQVSGGSVSQNVSLRASSGTNEFNFAVARNFQSGELFSGPADQLDFSKAGSFGTAYYTPGANFRNGTDIIYFGGANNYVPSADSAVVDPATKGFGWKVKDESIIATMFGTNYVQVATNSVVLSAGGTTRQNVWLFIKWDGTGNAAWYINGSEIATTTNGPTGLTGVNNANIILGAVADVALAVQNQNSISAFLLDREP